MCFHNSLKVCFKPLQAFSDTFNFLQYDPLPIIVLKNFQEYLVLQEEKIEKSQNCKKKHFKTFKQA